MQVRILLEPILKIEEWARLARGEISGLGLARLVPGTKGHTIEIYDVFLLEQVSGGASTELDDFAIAKLVGTLDDKSEDLRFWWHSHADMDVFWSGTDDSTIDKFVAAGWCVSMVVNKDNKHLVRVDVAEPRVASDHVPLEIVYPGEAEIRAFCKAEFTGKVKQLQLAPKPHKKFKRVRKAEQHVLDWLGAKIAYAELVELFDSDVAALSRAVEEYTPDQFDIIKELVVGTELGEVPDGVAATELLEVFGITLGEARDIAFGGELNEQDTLGWDDTPPFGRDFANSFSD